MGFNNLKHSSLACCIPHLNTCYILQKWRTIIQSNVIVIRYFNQRFIAFPGLNFMTFNI